MMYAAIALFAVSYVLMLVFSKYRPYVALGSALVFIVSGMLSFKNVLSANVRSKVNKNKQEKTKP